MVRNKNYISGDKKESQIRVIHADVLEFNKLSYEIRCFKPNIIFHLAGTRPVGNSWGTVQQAYQTNLIGTMNLLRSLQDIDCHSIVLVGSTAEYGRGLVPFQENQALNPLSAYGASKAAVTTLANLARQMFGLPVIVLRPTLVYGPGQGEHLFLSQLIKTALTGQPFLMTGGEQYRDFVYVSDVVEALWLAVNTPRAVGGFFNIGSGESLPLKVVAQRVFNLIGRYDLLKIGAKPYSEQEQFAYCVDINRAKQILNWQPKITLEHGLVKTVDWYSGCKKTNTINFL